MGLLLHIHHTSKGQDESIIMKESGVSHSNGNFKLSYLVKFKSLYLYLSILINS
jgi:hypothetical protein